MKKLSLILSVCICFVMLGGCGDSSKMDSLLDSQNASSDTADASDISSESSTSNVQAAAEVDIDLSKMDDTMAYSTAYNMLLSPDEYLGKTVRMKGAFATTYSEETQLNYFFIVLGDTTACCTQGMEFIWDDNSHAYPDDYPEENAEVEIVGICGQYEELGGTYFYIAADELTVL